MKTVKVMSIIGLVVAGLGILMFYTADYVTYVEDAEGIAGWLLIVSVWLIAQSVTSIVQAKKK